MQKMTPHYTADALSIKPTEGPWQTGSLQPASKFRTKECLIASATSCLYHYKAISVISIKMISNDNSKPQQQPHGGIPEKLAWSLGAMSERHWSKLKLAILSAGSRLPNIPYGPLIFLGPGNASLQIYVPLYLPDSTVIVHVTGKAESLFPCSEVSLHNTPLMSYLL